MKKLILYTMHIFLQDCFWDLQAFFCGTNVVSVKTLLIINLCAVRVWAEVLLPRQLWAYYCKSLPWVNFRCFCCFIIQKFLLIIDHFYLSIPLFTWLSSNLRAAISPFLLYALVSQVNTHSHCILIFNHQQTLTIIKSITSQHFYQSDNWITSLHRP